MVGAVAVCVSKGFTFGYAYLNPPSYGWGRVVVLFPEVSPLVMRIKPSGLWLGLVLIVFCLRFQLWLCEFKHTEV